MGTTALSPLSLIILLLPALLTSSTLTPSNKEHWCLSGQDWKLWKGTPTQLLCQADQPTKSSLIPPRPSCDKSYPKHSWQMPIGYVIYKQATNSMTIPLSFCSTQVVKKTCFKNFFGVEARTREVQHTSTGVSECKEAHRVHNLGPQENKVLQTEEEIDCFWMSSTKKTQNIVTISTSQGLLEKETLNIHHSFPMVKGCQLPQGSCLSSTGTLFWEQVPSQSLCQLKEVERGAGVLSMDRHSFDVMLTIPKPKAMFSISPNYTSFHENCTGGETQVVETEEGSLVGFLSTGKPHSLHNIMAKMAIWNMTDIMDLTSLRDVPHLATSEDLPIIQAKMRDLWEMTSHDLHLLHSEICEESRRAWDQAWALRNVAPSFSARSFMKRDDIQGVITTGFIVYNVCGHMENWEARKEGQCGDLWLLTSPPGLCMHFLTGDISLCPKSCPPRSPWFMLQFNSTHNIDLHTCNLLTLPPTRGSSLDLSFNFDPMFHTSATLYNVQDLNSNHDIFSMVDSLRTRTSMIEKIVVGASKEDSHDNESSESEIPRGLHVIVSKVGEFWNNLGITLKLILGGFIFLISWKLVSNILGCLANKRRTERDEQTASIISKLRRFYLRDTTAPESLQSPLTYTRAESRM